MLDTVLLIVAALNLAFMAAWLTIGALENLFHPFLNETYTAQVMDMERMREEFPEAFEHVSYRRVNNPALRKVLFRFIVAWELTAMLALWVASVSVLSVLWDGLAVADALAIGILATALFSSIWAGFLVAGNYFCYWFGHEGSQNTHFQMLIWGLVNVILLTCVGINFS